MNSAVPAGLAVFDAMDPAEVPGYSRLSLRDNGIVAVRSKQDCVRHDYGTAEFALAGHRII
jgi:hypothetical protein